VGGRSAEISFIPEHRKDNLYIHTQTHIQIQDTVLNFGLPGAYIGGGGGGGGKDRRKSNGSTSIASSSNNMVAMDSLEEKIRALMTRVEVLEVCI
jgi:hypothetical protein